MEFETIQSKWVKEENQLNKNQYPWDNESINNINSLYIDYDENGCVVDKTYLNPLFIEDKSQTKCVSKEDWYLF